MLKIMNKKNILIILFLILIVIMYITVKRTFANYDIGEPVLITENSDLTYYLNVKYDGIDILGIDSENLDTSPNNIITSKLDSGFIYVEDKIPEGLEFEDFVIPDLGASIGANYNYQINNGQYFDQSCHGNILDDTNEVNFSSGTWNSSNTEYYYHGLHYNKNTRTVSFFVENLQAGCTLTVGIKTKVPYLTNYPLTSRIDFYNYAIISEGINSSISNVLDSYIGSDSETLYNVKYRFSGISGEDSPIIPPTVQYAENVTVGTFSPGYVKGYKFTGWQSNDVTINNNTFTMPNHDVEITGNFVESGPYNVTYVIDGTKPDSYELPNTMQYYFLETVNINSLKKGDIIDGYKFLGWETNDVEILEESFLNSYSYYLDLVYGNYKRFIMPEKNVTFTGKFEKVKYKLTYKFNDSVLPPNSASLLPESEFYDPGDDITLATINNPNGYKFLGWNKETNFKMPENDVIVYGTWKEFYGYFEPKITVTIADEKEYYNPNDMVHFVIDIYNDSDTSIYKSQVLISDDATIYTTGLKMSTIDSGYEEIGANQHYYMDYYLNLYDIRNRSSVSSSNNDYGDFGDFGDYGDYDNDLEINNDDFIYPSEINLNFLITNAFEYDYSGHYEFKASDDVEEITVKIQPNIYVCQEIDGENVGNIFQYKLTNSSGLEKGFFLEEGKCVRLYLNPGTYKLLQITPQEYNIKNVTGKFSSNNASFNIQYEEEAEVTFTNKFVKKKFMHSFGRAINEINNSSGGSLPDPWIGW